MTDLVCSAIINNFEPGGKYDKIPVSTVMTFLIRKFPHLKTEQKRGRLFMKAFRDIGHKVRRMTPGSRIKIRKKIIFIIMFARLAV